MVRIDPVGSNYWSNHLRRRFSGFEIVDVLNRPDRRNRRSRWVRQRITDTSQWPVADPMSLSSAYLIRLSPQVFDREAIGLDVVRHSLNAKLGGQILAVAARSGV